MAGDLDDHIRRALESVADPMALLVDMFANAPIGVQLYAPDGHCLVTNQAFRDIFGSEPPPAYNVFEDRLLAEAGVIESVRRGFAGELIVMPPVWYDTARQPLRAAGEPRRCAVACTSLPLFDAERRVTHVALFFKDVTAEYAAREQAEAERDRLRETRGQLQAFLDNAPVIVVVKDLEGRVLVVNRETTRAFGLDVDRARGRTASDLFGTGIGAGSAASASSSSRAFPSSPPSTTAPAASPSAPAASPSTSASGGRRNRSCSGPKSASARSSISCRWRRCSRGCPIAASST
jgi:PAS domain-containing protein